MAKTAYKDGRKRFESNPQSQVTLKIGSIGWRNSFVVSGTWIGTCKREQGHTASSMLSDNDLPVAHSDCKDLFAD
jgi:hypothetical protein